MTNNNRQYWDVYLPNNQDNKTISKINVKVKLNFDVFRIVRTIVVYTRFRFLCSFDWKKRFVIQIYFRMLLNSNLVSTFVRNWRKYVFFSAKLKTKIIYYGCQTFRNTDLLRWFFQLSTLILILGLFNANLLCIFARWLLFK